MKLRSTLTISAAAMAVALAGVTPLGGASVAHAAVAGGPVLALTDANVIVGFNATAPGTLVQSTPITGLQPGETVVGFDVRPATGELFAVGAAGSTGRLYVINTTNGAARQIGAAPFGTALPTGGTWAVDFNPTVDRIRLVHSSGANYRVNPLNGALAATDTSVAPAKPSAVAYDRSTSPAPTATTLFAIDDAADTLNLIGGVNGMPSPNGGVTTSVGALGVDAGANVGFDIAPQGDALATLSVAGNSGLYTVNLASGAATLVGNVGDGSLDLLDIALPRPPVGAMLALDDDGMLLAFDAASPGTVTSVAITGLEAGESIVGIDTRPATGEVIGIGLAGTAGRVYRIDRASGAATQIGDPFTVAAPSPAWSVDFNPTVDRIRLIAATGGNYRINPNNGVLAATDTPVAPAVVTAAAYDRPIATTTATTLFAIDTVANTLNLIGGPDGIPSPNGGVTTLRGPLGVDATRAGLDISPVGEAVAALEVGGATGLYAVNLVTGGAESLGQLGDGNADVIDITFVARFPAGASQYYPVSAARLLDTRTTTKPAAGSTTELQVAGVAGVPAGATAVVLNVTGTEAAAPGFVTVYPTGLAQPVVSNQNLVPGQTRANLATVKLGAGGKVSIYTLSSVEMVVDVLGYYAPASSTAGRFTALPPGRLIDTRQSSKVAARGSVQVPVLGQQGVPATGVSAVLVTLAGTDVEAPGYLTAYAGGPTVPGISNLNLEDAGSTASNLAIVPVAADGTITVYSLSSAHVVVDVAGWFSDATGKGGYSGLLVPVDPARVLDTRIGTGATAGAMAPESSIDVTLAGAGGVPAFGASSALVNVTSVEPVRPGYLTVYPVGQTLGDFSSVNVDRTDRVTPNLVGATLGTGGAVTIYNNAGGHVVGDVAGWFTS
jgi:hypothetical protein